MIKSVSQFIDPTIEDPKMREFDWFISVYTSTQEWHLVLAAKWRRANYILGVKP